MLQLFSLLESDFNPLQLCKVVAPLLEQLTTLNQPVTGAWVGLGFWARGLSRQAHASSCVCGHAPCHGWLHASPAPAALRSSSRIPLHPSPAAGASPVQDMPLEAYSVALQRVAVAKMVRQLSEVYSVIRVSHMSELAPFIGFGQVS